MILTLFTVRVKRLYRQVHRTHQSGDVGELIRIGREWENDELKQYYQITMGPEGNASPNTMKYKTI